VGNFEDIYWKTKIIIKAKQKNKRNLLNYREISIKDKKDSFKALKKNHLFYRNC
jgi:hypothetical protein